MSNAAHIDQRQLVLIIKSNITMQQLKLVIVASFWRVRMSSISIADEEMRTASDVYQRQWPAMTLPTIGWTNE